MSRTSKPTDDEQLFRRLVVEQIPNADFWYHQDAGSEAPWMMVSLDVEDGKRIMRTWRCDFDGERLEAGLSPAGLNWDDGVRASDAGIDVHGADGMSLEVVDIPTAAEVAVRWFRSRK
ncbi:hypothetical protein GCM10010988_17180 [Cnuibacter physcomitrellae]|uniref:Uncharacterized protein n=1 Tax=Cnuibacter physcomitrellae TaxID=1619308 RepID=A0A1X9LMM8_9MICO|nr:hypothetical protein [Cnuibacter physcomitrellae]ARJ06465.1 hypothetical protein B5808_15515 [Cnuibacter physcomitrellae]GGI38078.1 hypothetical protein GCM10010988_17180 [Cnuibacter physcomitrellae]